MKIQQWLFKILRKQNVTDGRTHGRTDNVKTVYPPQTKFAGGIIIFVSPASILVGEWLQRQPHFWAWSLYVRSKWDVSHCMPCLVLTDTYLYNFTKGKTYSVNQRLRHTMCLQHPCYDAGCYLRSLCVSQCGDWMKILIFKKKEIFFFEDSDFFFQNWEKSPKFHWEHGRITAPEKSPKFHWEHGRISAPENIPKKLIYHHKVTFWLWITPF